MQYLNVLRNPSINPYLSSVTMSSSVQNVVMKCLYTKHLQKKRKTWFDGKIHVSLNIKAQSGFCKLYTMTGRYYGIMHHVYLKSR